MFRLSKKIFTGSLTGLVNRSNHAKCVSLSKEKYVIQLTFINLRANENNQEFHYYPFAAKLDRYAESCNTLNDLSDKVCIPNKTIWI